MLDGSFVATPIGVGDGLLRLVGLAIGSGEDSDAADDQHGPVGVSCLRTIATVPEMTRIQSRDVIEFRTF
jgi:hypothetical protein